MHHTLSHTQNIPQQRLKSLLQAFLQIIGGSLFIALLAQVKIPLFFTPVCLSLQTFAIMLVAGSLGKTKGTLAVLAYLAEAAIGFPVLAGGGSSLAAFFRPTGGYLVGFLLQAYLVGQFIESRKTHSSLKLFIGLELISLTVLAMGSLWLAHFVGWDYAFILGFVLFIAGDLLKALIASSILSAWHKSLN